jgi:hydroxymethylpyrimidine pyrophosphatase-like HAD family hydrolase
MPNDMTMFAESGISIAMGKINVLKKERDSHTDPNSADQESAKTGGVKSGLPLV